MRAVHPPQSSRLLPVRDLNQHSRVKLQVKYEVKVGCVPLFTFFMAETAQSAAIPLSAGVPKELVSER